MKILQFGFGNVGAHIYLPHQYEPNCVVYTGTHDNDTTVGWWANSATEEEKKLATAYLGIGEDGVHWAFNRAALTSVANSCIIPVQDILGLGSEARMNVPSESDGSWTWRLQAGALTAEHADKLATLGEIADRAVAAKEALAQGEQGDGKASKEFAA
jgi:4-alpha-glucanotransferase